jgi:putative SOS response-associated peptidase YedK
MCGRFVQQRPVSEIAAIFAAEPLFEDPGGHYNVTPSQRVAAVVERPDRQRAVAPFIWGLVPSWTPKDKVAPTRLFNARSESVVDRPAFRGLLERHRLIVPADGFYEWRSGAHGPRQAFYIRRIDGRPLALGGLWTTWHDPDVARHVDEPLRTTTILTTSPNGLMSQIHDRMPVVIAEGAIDAWLDPSFGDTAALRSMLRPAPDDLLEAIPVGAVVGNARNQGRELTSPIGRPLVAVHSTDTGKTHAESASGTAPSRWS